MNFVDGDCICMNIKFKSCRCCFNFVAVSVVVDDVAIRESLQNIPGRSEFFVSLSPQFGWHH